MAIGQNIQRRPRNVLQGISLIEVMVALVVLSTGILALTLLQTSVTRAAAESKIRSLAMSYAQSELERIRAETTALGNYTSLADVPVNKVSLTATNIAGSVEATGTQFKEGILVNHLIQSTSSSLCSSSSVPAGTPPPCFIRTTDTAAAAVGVPDYKTIAVTVYWTGADSAAAYDKSLTAFDVMSVLSLSGSTDLITSGGGGSGGPKIIQTKASADMAGTGVIPIATGGAHGEATAASNPKPLVSNSTGTAATSFTVLTYQDPNTGNILIQREVDTKVVSCKCRNVGFSNSLTNFYTTKMRPTYWNGTFYSSPKSLVGDGYALTDTPDASAAATETYASTTRNINQDQDACDTCCRDHHDPASTGAKAKFDPYMTDGETHKHYNYPLDSSGNPTGTPVEVIASNTTSIYSEACRLIRVDGLWRTAVDLNQEHMSLLKTNQTTTTSGSPPVTTYAWGPTATATGHYVDFVKKFLALRVIDPSVTPKTATGDALTPAEVSTLETNNAINDPALIAIATSTSARKYLHDRGLYLDYLGPEAVSYLNQVLDSCTETDATRINCILPYLPFVTINTTELANWTSTGNLQNLSSGTEPKTGVMAPVVTGTNNATATGNVGMYRSNSGLVYALPIDHFDGMINPSDGTFYNAAAKTTDVQNFQFTTTGILDTDSDGIPDENDNCPAIANPTQIDTDGDGQGDACDNDDDGDGFTDNPPSDNCPLVSNVDQLDADSDGIGSACDNCPVDSNSSQADLDGDNIGDACDTDTDNDGVLNASDNCPVNANPDQADADGDGIGNVCDSSTPPVDSDGDGVLDTLDNCPSVGNPTQTDTDADGVGDACDPTPYAPFTFQAKITLGSQPASASRPLLSRTQTVNSVISTTSCGSWISSAPYVFNCGGATWSSQTLTVTNYNFVRVTSGTSAKVYNPCPQGSLTNAQYSSKVDAVYCDLYPAPTVTRTRGATTTAVTISAVRTGSFTGTGLSSAVDNSTIPTTTHTTKFDLTGVIASDIYNVNFGNPVETLLTPSASNNHTDDKCASTGKCTCNASQLPVYNFSTCP